MFRLGTVTLIDIIENALCSRGKVRLKVALMPGKIMTKKIDLMPVKMSFP